jgi:hypothetical protein
MTNNSEIGIIILDIFSEKHLEKCLQQIPESLKSNVFVSSNTNNASQKENNQLYIKSLSTKVNGFKFERECSFASMRNRGIMFFRNLKTKYLFFLNSNCLVEDERFFDFTIQKASVFGTWFMTGPSHKENTFPVEDVDSGLTLSVSPELNTSVMFMLASIVKNCGYFVEQFYATDVIDVLDYTKKLFKLNIYPPHPFNPIIDYGLKFESAELTTPQYPDFEKHLNHTFGYFQHLHGYVPGHNDPPGHTKDQMFSAMEKIQKIFAKPYEK